MPAKPTVKTCNVRYSEERMMLFREEFTGNFLLSCRIIEANSVTKISVWPQFKITKYV